MLGCVFDLLYRKPEQEKELLSQLVNKLGDPVKKVASKAAFFLLKLGKIILVSSSFLFVVLPACSVCSCFYNYCCCFYGLLIISTLVAIYSRTLHIQTKAMATI